jgi:16S rRNA (guanine966-N2)-methyltransferase
VTRVVSGVARGARLRVPETGTRPTSDRAREAVFSSLESMRGPWDGARVLDLYAGSGAFGLESASRGAARVDLVESDRRAAAVIEQNTTTVRSAGAPARVTVHRTTVESWTSTARAEGPFDLIFCDPPYSTPSDRVAELLADLCASQVLDAAGLVVLERSARDPDWSWAGPLHARWDRRYGEAHIWIGELER